MYLLSGAVLWDWAMRHLHFCQVGVRRHSWPQQRFAQGDGGASVLHGAPALDHMCSRYFPQLGRSAAFKHFKGIEHSNIGSVRRQHLSLLTTWLGKLQGMPKYHIGLTCTAPGQRQAFSRCSLWVEDHLLHAEVLGRASLSYARALTSPSAPCCRRAARALGCPLRCYCRPARRLGLLLLLLAFLMLTIAI